LKSISCLAFLTLRKKSDNHVNNIVFYQGKDGFTTIKQLNGDHFDHVSYSAEARFHQVTEKSSPAGHPALAAIGRRCANNLSLHAVPGRTNGHQNFCESAGWAHLAALAYESCCQGSSGTQ
jgi:hypothetical protein